MHFRADGEIVMIPKINSQIQKSTSLHVNTKINRKGELLGSTTWVVRWSVTGT